jgi:hypothetical protein
MRKGPSRSLVRISHLHAQQQVQVGRVQQLLHARRAEVLGPQPRQLISVPVKSRYSVRLGARGRAARQSIYLYAAASTGLQTVGRDLHVCEHDVQDLCTVRV